MRTAVFLDRDGVLNEPIVAHGKALSPRSVEEFRVIPAAVRGANLLRSAGYLLAVVTNQPDISRGLMAMDELERMHDVLARAMPIDDIRVCPHDGVEGCRCRKPAPGMLMEAAIDLDIDLAASWMVGDRWVDIAAGAAAGARTVLVEREYSYAGTSSGSPASDLRPTLRVRDLLEAAEWIIGGSHPG